MIVTRLLSWLRKDLLRLPWDTMLAQFAELIIPDEAA